VLCVGETTDDAIFTYACTCEDMFCTHAVKYMGTYVDLACMQCNGNAVQAKHNDASACIIACLYCYHYMTVDLEMCRLVEVFLISTPSLLICRSKFYHGVNFVL